MRLKITNKHSNQLRLKLLAPIALDQNKKYKLGVEKIRFKQPNFYVRNFTFTLIVNINKNKNSSEFKIEGYHTMKSFKYVLREKITDAYDKHPEGKTLKNFLSDLDRNFTFDIKIINEHQYVTYFTLPECVSLQVSDFGNFIDLFSLKMTIYEGGRIYISSKTPSILNVATIIEWHCDLAELSYSTHGEKPHNHSDGYILHTTFRQKHFPGDFFMDEPGQITYTPLKKNILDLHEITLTAYNENGHIIPLEDIIVYLHLIDEKK